MTIHSASGLVGHQDYGTGLAGSEERTPTAAAYFAGADASTNPHVISGLTLTYDSGNISISKGAALLQYTGTITVPTTPTDAPADYTETWNGPIAFPVSINAITLPAETANGENHIYLTIDPTQNDTIHYETTTTDNAPANPSLKIGVVDTAANTIDELNRVISTPYADDADTVDGKHAAELTEEAVTTATVFLDGVAPEFGGTR